MSEYFDIDIFEQEAAWQPLRYRCVMCGGETELWGDASSWLMRWTKCQLEGVVTQHKRVDGEVSN